MGAKSISDCVQCVFMGFCLRGGVTYCSYIQFTANQSPYVIFGDLYGLGGQSKSEPPPPIGRVYLSLFAVPLI